MNTPKLSYALIASALLNACGTEPKDDSTVCISLKFPFDNCKAVTKSPSNEVPKDDEFSVGQPIPMTIDAEATPQVTLERVEGISVWYMAHVTVFNENINGGLTTAHMLSTRHNQLESSAFTLTPPAGVTVAGIENTYEFPSESAAFRAASIFVNASVMDEWLGSFGYIRDGLPISLESDAIINGDSSNALFVPGFAGAQSRIMIGQGDGVALQNLATDADVVRKLYAQAVVYESLTTVTGESLYLSSGLATALVMLKNDDPCFAPTVCPASGSSVCREQTQCLYNGQNSLTIATALNQRDRVANIAGAIWDAKVSSGLSADEFASLLLSTIYVLPHDADYVAFGNRLAEVDIAMTNGKNVESILASFRKHDIEVSEPSGSVGYCFFLMSKAELRKEGAHAAVCGHLSK